MSRFCSKMQAEIIKHPVWIKNCLSSAYRDDGKRILAKRYEMMNREGKDEHDFRIKSRKFFYRGVLFQTLRYFNDWKLSIACCSIVNQSNLLNSDKLFSNYLHHLRLLSCFLQTCLLNEIQIKSVSGLKSTKNCKKRQGSWWKRWYLDSLTVWFNNKVHHFILAVISL